MADVAGIRQQLPTGTVTFLRTDVEGSMRLAWSLGPRWDAVNERHLTILRDAVASHGGVVVRTEGDALFAVFADAAGALLAAMDGQRALQAHDWPPDGHVRVRMGLHSGPAHRAGDDYGGFEVNRAARVAATGHGGQIVLSDATRALAAESLADRVTFRDLGRHVLRDVPGEEHLFQADVAGLPVDFPPPQTDGRRRGNLPERVSSFIGREDDVLEIGRLSSSARLVTLTGPGGIGKSSLAVEVARAAADGALDGAWFVALDAITDADLVMGVVARTLGLHDGPERAAATALPGFLADRSVLLILDNLEHLLDAAGEIGALLRASPRSRIIATSRAPLRIAGEQEYPVRPLGLATRAREGTDDRGASERLFIERAQAVRPGWQPGSDMTLVHEICRLLDGLPLGIELAAARISLMPLAALRDRLAARLPLPGAGPRDVPARQRTLDAAIGWSHDLLDPPIRSLLHDLAVFEGGFDLDQAVAVAEPDVAGVDVLDGLATLADQSLVVRDADDAAGPVPHGSGIRFRMLATIQAFAQAKLAASDREAEVRRRHAEAYLALMEEAARHLMSIDQPSWIDRLRADLGNLRAATRWAIDTGDADLALRLVAASWRFWQQDGQLSEGNELMEAALAMPGADERGPARLAAIGAAGSIAYWRAETTKAHHRYQEQLDLAVALGDRAAEADAAFNLLHTAWIVGATPSDEMPAAIERVVALYRELGDEIGVARTQSGLANVLMDRDGPDVAEPLVRASLERFIALGDVHYEAMSYGSLSWGAFQRGDLGESIRWSVLALRTSHSIRAVGSTTITLHVGVVLAQRLGRFEDAAVMQGAFEALCERYGVRPPAGLDRLLSIADPMVEVRASLPPDRVAEALERGRRLSLDEAVATILRVAEEAATAL
jgi:predicted ATPase/class 3 adenylate cyclase